jgi:hypothetical protein
VNKEQWKEVPQIFTIIGCIFGKCIFSNVITLQFADNLISKYSTKIKTEFIQEFSLAVMDLKK